MMKKIKRNKLVVIITFLVFIISIIVGYILYTTFRPGIKQCPDAWIENNMPGPMHGKAQNSQYFVIDGERKEIDDYNLAWIQTYCPVKKQTVY